MGNIILIIDKKHCKSFKLAPFCLNLFCYMFYVSILRLVTYYVPLNRKYGGNYLKYLFELYSFLFFSFYWENLLKRTFFTNLNKKSLTSWISSLKSASCQVYKPWTLWKWKYRFFKLLREPIPGHVLKESCYFKGGSLVVGNGQTQDN